MTIILTLLLILAGFCAVMMSVHDWRARIIPDVYLFPFMLIGLIVVVFFPWFFSIAESVIAAVIGYGLSFGTGWIFRKFAERRAKTPSGVREDVNSYKLKDNIPTTNYQLPTSTPCALRSANFIEPIGLGDVKLLAAGGVWLGITGLAIALIVSCVAGGIWGLRRKQKFIPFAPFFFVGMICAFIALWFLI
jgi:prepilin signal peptidase PulO-like enzyme (type II secretory pathway)